MRGKNSSGKVVAVAKTLWAEVLSTRGMHNISKEPLTTEERVWVFELLVLSPHLRWIQPKKINIAILENKNELGRVQKLVEEAWL